MPVTEIATFQILAPNNLQSEPIASLLARGIRSQISYSSTPVYLFAEVSDTSSIYLISGWIGIEQHQESGTSDVNKEVMAQLVPQYLTFKGLVHPSIDFSTFPNEVSVVVVEKGEEAKGAAKEISVSAKWVQSGVDENGETHRISAYGPEQSVAILEASSGVKGVTVLKRAVSFAADGSRQVQL